MNLFAASGVDLPRAGAGPRRPPAPRSLKLPLFAYKVVAAARGRLAFAPTPAQAEIARDYARKARAGFAKRSEQAVRSTFVHDVLIGLLGYRGIDPERGYSLAEERQVARGAVDVALGRFDETAALNEILAPFELKGPKTHDLDAPMPGRGRSPVQQAWDYAADIKGARWVLVSNCLEIRLYGFGRGRDAYEAFDLTRLDEAEEHARLLLLLGADRLLDGALDGLLRETDSAYKDVTEELYAQYSALRDMLIDYLVNGADGPRLTPLAAIEPAQKILDRILFIAFAQRTDLLPSRLLERAIEAQNEFSPVPIWNNFATVFRAVDRGDPRLPNVWPYNGGLFADDAVVDRVTLPDALAGEVAALGQWDYNSEVPVTLLGHIFEQSVTDIERLKARAKGEPDPAVSKRKREGVVYTPDMVTRFLVEKTIGVTLGEAFEAARTRHGFAEGAPAATETAFWRDYLGALRALTVVDPACGSGAFLVAAFDALYFEYARAAKALAGLGAPVDFDVADEILSRNLFGVDLNPESVEITRLSLWLKTARREHRLASLEATIRVGDSLVEDGAYTLRPFAARAAFPEVFARGGFDIVLGNPPYVRMELIKAVKPYLAEHYAVASDRADLYAYFYERGLALLREGGRLGFISSSTFFRTGSGEPLRRLLTERASIETIVDFGDAQIFSGVTTYPAVVSMRKGAPAPGEIDYLVVEGEPPADLGRAFREAARKMPRARLSADSWQIEDDALAKLRDKIRAGRKTLGEVYGAPL
ncbi:MAG TPA: N-6 DNA methylase, partial [Roseiarcus sp.]|nr:N-6 DNA methylase [Roseiarcus sp.]